MELLQALLENEVSQQYLNENSELILAASEVFAEFPQVIRDYIRENLDDFIEPGDLEATRENMIIFTDSAVSTLLEELSGMINGTVPLEEYCTD